jgi:hypothetical protein
LSRNLYKNPFIAKKPCIKQGLPVEKNVLLTAAFISVLLLSATLGALFVNCGRANPFLYEQEEEEVSPPSYVSPPTIIIFSPENNTVHSVSNISFTFKVIVVVPTLPELFYYYLDLSEVYYKASWLSNNTYLDLEAVKNSTPSRTRTFSNDSLEQWGTYWTLSGYALSPNFAINMTGVPEGSHYLEVFAVLQGSRRTGRSYGSVPTIHYGRYTLIGSSIVNFTIDTPPDVSILALENTTYNVSDVSLNFTVSQAVSKITYCLDGQENVTIGGNTTLTGLPNGEHNITVYATDEAGNVGASETMYFSVDAPEPFPTTIVVASAASAAIVGIGILVYLKKRKH